MQIFVKNFSSHPSIIKFKDKFKLSKKFSFQCVSETTVRKAVENVPSDKTTAAEIPINVLKNSEIIFLDLTNCINEALRNNKFPDSLKLSDITPVYKKCGLIHKASYIPVNVLPLLSKVFEKIIYEELYEHLKKTFNSQYQSVRDSLFDWSLQSKYC